MQILKIMPSLTQKQLKCFWSKILIPEDRESCWEWLGTKKNNYGYFSLNGKGCYFSHRMSYFLDTGTDPHELKVLHRCDNPSCQNPSHLFLGTQLENIQDMDRKGRRRPAFGEKNGTHTKPSSVLRGVEKVEAKLNEDQVREIYELYSKGNQSNSQIARKFGITHVNVERIAKGKIWKHLFPNILLENNGKWKGSGKSDKHWVYIHPEKIKKGINHLSAKLTEENVLQIRNEFSKGDVMYITLAKKYNVTIGTIWKIVTGKIWKHLLPKEYVPPKINYAFGYINA